MDRGREDLADDERGPAEVGERKRITQLLAAIGGVHDPEADAVVQDELAARAAHFAALARAGRLDRTVASRPGDEAVRDFLFHRGDYDPVTDASTAALHTRAKQNMTDHPTRCAVSRR